MERIRWSYRAPGESSKAFSCLPSKYRLWNLWANLIYRAGGAVTAMGVTSDLLKVLQQVQ